jgi:hypothetical protein
MIRTQVVKLGRASLQARLFSGTALRAADGDTGGTRSGGAAQSYLTQRTPCPEMYLTVNSSDTFTKREQASENFYIRQKEREAYVNTLRLTSRESIHSWSIELR